MAYALEICVPLGTGQLLISSLFCSILLGVRVVHQETLCSKPPRSRPICQKDEAAPDSSKFLGDGDREPNQNFVGSLFPERWESARIRLWVPLGSQVGAVPCHFPSGAMPSSAGTGCLPACLLPRACFSLLHI